MENVAEAENVHCWHRVGVFERYPHGVVVNRHPDAGAEEMACHGMSDGVRVLVHHLSVDLERQCADRVLVMQVDQPLVICGVDLVGLVDEFEIVQSRAGMSRAAHLGGSRQSDLQARKRIERHAHADIDRVLRDAVIVQHADEELVLPWPQPAQPRRSEWGRVEPRYTHLRERPGVVGQGKSRDPARAPPVGEIARIDHRCGRRETGGSGGLIPLLGHVCLAAKATLGTRNAATATMSAIANIDTKVRWRDC